MRIFRRNDGRYYAYAEPFRDLLGDDVIVTYHGKEKNRAGGLKTYVANDSRTILQFETEIVRTRIAHGYVECSPPNSPNTSQPEVFIA